MVIDNFDVIENSILSLDIKAEKKTEDITCK